jgi:ubiquinone biosynthesis protein UbiJ
MLAVLALGASESLINQWIDLDFPTRLQLNQLQGKLLRVVIASPQLSVDAFFDDGKVRLSPTPTGMPDQSNSIFEQRPYDAKQTIQAANTTLSVDTLVDLAKLLWGTAGETGNIPLHGDMGLLLQLQQIMAQTEPDLASKLAPWIGAIPASQIGQIVQQSKTQFLRLGKNISTNASESMFEDSGLFAARWKMDKLQQGSRELKQSIERVQARLKQLQQTINARVAEHPPLAQQPSLADDAAQQQTQQQQ